MKFYLDHWKEITSDPFVLTSVSNCEIEFDHEPTPSRHNFTPEYQFSVGEQQAIDNEITEFLAKNLIELSNPEQGEIISPIFIRPKKESGKVRVIFNLKHLNDAVTYRKFKMDTLDAAIRLMKPGCFMTSIDLRDEITVFPSNQLIENTLNLIGEEYCINLLLYPFASQVAHAFLQKYSNRFFEECSS